MYLKRFVEYPSNNRSIATTRFVSKIMEGGIDLLDNTYLSLLTLPRFFPRIFRYDFHNPDWLAPRNALNEVDWHSIFYDTPIVDVLWEKFTSTLWEVINEHVPNI